MKRTIISWICLVLLVLSVPVNVSASEDLPMVVDYADLLSADAESALETQALALREAYECDIVILTVDSLDGKTPQEFADDFFFDNDYGYGDAFIGNGVLFLISMEERDWFISTYDDAMTIFTDYGVQQLGEGALSYLAEDNFDTVFQVYLTMLPEYFEAYHNGTPIDGYASYSGDYYHGEQDELLYYDEPFTPSIGLSILFGLAVGGITVLIMRSSMNSRKKQHSASQYLASGSFHLRSHQDLFLYSNVTKTRKQQNNSSGGGGSSVRHSSGGRRSGGGGGKF